jgi:hypothetical protein
MSKLNCLQILGRIFLLSVVGTFSFLGATVQSVAQALQCGANITTDTTLTADLGPCPLGGLGIDGAPAHVTLSLNGHTISGSGVGVGVTVGAVGSGLTIKGPGTISNFVAGISMGGGPGDVLVYDLVLKRNQGGIEIGGRQATVRILNNVITGGRQGQTGISLTDSGTVYVYKNTISGFVTAVLLPFETGSVVDENLITLNQTGIYLPVSLFGLPSYCIRGNVVTLNQGTGIQIGSTAGRSSEALTATIAPCQTVEDNTVTFNGGSGIAVTGVPAQVQDNIVSFNRINGISETNIPTTNQVIGNRLRNNGTDLFWDGIGTVCWQQNIFNTSSPATLPPCD